jgi:hypothetical protein
MRNLRNPTGGVNQEALEAVHREAVEASAAGLGTIPPAEDGSKRPLPESSGKWEVYKTRLPTPEELARWWPGRSGIGIIAGKVSGNADIWDFDCRPTFEAFRMVARQSGLGAIIDRVEAGYCDHTPGGGVRWIVRYPHEVKREPGTRIILARRPKREEEKEHANDKIKTLIEMPAFSIVAPTNGRVHPTGKPYVRQSGSFATIASYDAEEREALMEIASGFDEMVKFTRAGPEKGPGAKGDRPGDDFNSRTTWADVLVPSGWTLVFSRGETSYWRRPGKRHGISASTNFGGTDLLVVFTTSSQFKTFDEKKSYDRFAAYAVLEHGGDFSAAARALAARGYGKKSNQSVEEEYREHAGCIQMRRESKEGVVSWVTLTNFTARIVADITLDDDVETTKTFEIEATLCGRVTRFTIPSHQFASLNWAAEKLGARAIVQPGQMIAKRAAVAIQVLSGEIPESRVFAHTGWRRIDDTWVFLHAGAPTMS